MGSMMPYEAIGNAAASVRNLALGNPSTLYLSWQVAGMDSDFSIIVA